MGVRAVLFDMYNTLVRNDPSLWLMTFAEICRRQGLGVDPEHLWRVWKAIEGEERRRRVIPSNPEASPPFKSYRRMWTECFREAFRQLGLRGDEEAAAALCIEDLGKREPFPGALPLLSSLRGRVRVGVVSNADVAFLYPLLARLALPVEAAVCSEEVRAYKPHPRPFLVVLRWLGVSPEEALFVGDSPEEDVRGAKGVGLRTLWLNRDGKALPPGVPAPDAQASSIEEVAAFCAREVL
jgi:2-haloalkanoic acid dehalogenase type II